MRLLALILVLLLILPTDSLEAPHVKVQVRPTFSFCMPAPEGCISSVVVMVRVAPNSRNRTLWVVCLPSWEDGWYTVSTREVEGERGPANYSVKWRGIPPDNYQVRAVLGDEEGPWTQAQANFRVVGDEEEVGP